MYLLGIDVGSSSLKAAVFDIDGNTIAVEKEEYPIYTPCDGYAEQNAEDYYTALIKALAKIDKEVLAKVEGIGFGGQSPTDVFVDREGKPVYPAIMWRDTRAKKQFERQKQTFTFDELNAFAGCPIPKSENWDTLRMAWLKEEHPEIMAKVYKVFQPKDYLIFRLSGEFVTDNWSARSYANTKTGKLNGEIFDFCGLSQEIAPKTYHVDEVCGVVNNEDATSLGLRKGVKIICGSSDGFAAMIASGVLAEYNLAFNSTGTSEIIGCAREVKGKLENIYIFPEGVTREKDICLGPTQSGGSSLLWLCNQVLHIPFEEMVAYAEKAESGSDGLVFLPYLCGERAPIWDSKARGCFFGLKNTHTTAEIARSVMEGVAFSVRSVIEEAGQTPAKIRLVGGGSKIPVWCQIRADVLGIPVEIVDCEEACAQGGAILAGKGVGVYSSLQEGSQKTCKIKTTYFPNPAVKGKYDKNYEVYKALYQATKHLN